MKIVTKHQIKELEKLVGKDKVFLKHQLSEDYSHDELSGTFGMPDVMIPVTTTEEIRKIMAYANQHKIPVVVRGSGTGLVGAAVAIHGGIMLETTAMNNILELDRENLTVTVEPGVLLMDLASYVEEEGFLYPPDPGEKTATIGGNIATNAGGMRAVKYGVTRDFVRGLEVVLPSGEVLNLGGKIVKNSSGYSLKDLIVGSEGTLAVITKAILKLTALPEASVSLLVPFSDIDLALQAVPEIIQLPLETTAIEFMELDTIIFSEEYLGKRFPDTDSSAYLLLTVDGGSAQQVEQDSLLLAEEVVRLGALDAFLVDTEERKDSVWTARGAFLEAIKASTTEMDECDVVVPRNHIAEFIRFTHELSKELDMRMPSFGHAGDGNLHVYLCKDDMSQKEFEEKLDIAFDALYGLAAEMGGQVSGEHGIGYAKKKYLARQVGDTQIQLMQGIKKVFDPHGILNPDKIF